MQSARRAMSAMLAAAYPFWSNCSAAAVIEAHFAAWPPLVDWALAVPAPALDRLVALSFAVMRAFRDDVVVRAGGRLWSERQAVDATLPAPFVGWIATTAAFLEQAADDGSVHPRLDPLEAADALVCAMFGVHTVSDALDGRVLVEEHLSALWLLLLPGLREPSGDHRDLVRRCRALRPPQGCERSTVLLTGPADAGPRTGATPRSPRRSSSTPRPRTARTH